MPDHPPGHEPTALVLAGGGALGAYEAGALRYVLETLPAELGCGPCFDIFAGTSVGALNASFLAASADDLPRAARALYDFWDAITFERILRFGRRELTDLLQLVLGRVPARQRLQLPTGRPPGAAPHPPVAGLFDTSPLRDKMRVLIPWRKLNRNIDEGLIRGLALCATEICTGRSVIFHRVSGDTDYRAGRDPNKELREVTFTADHALASAAIPFLFPAVQVGGVCYTDGALRQNTPLNPALRMGARRVLVISLTQDPHVASRYARLGCRRNPFPGALFLLGKTVKIFMNQSLDYELNRIEMYNRLIDGGCEVYGEEFIRVLNRVIGDERNATFRRLRTAHIRPRRNLDQVALDALQQAPRELLLPGVTGTVLGRVLASATFLESELLGLLMFTPTFVHQLLELGYRDAEAARDQLLGLFEP